MEMQLKSNLQQGNQFAELKGTPIPENFIANLSSWIFCSKINNKMLEIVVFTTWLHAANIV